MSVSDAELDRMQAGYKTAVDKWVAAIRVEEQLASVPHSVAEIDTWEDAHFEAEDLRGEVETAKLAYEAALRARFFGIE